MSGPIVRKYGFPNFEAIFGAREVPHGAPEEPAESPQGEPAGGEKLPPKSSGSPPGADATREEKESEDSAQL